jgi:purine nucleosidase
MKRLVIDTDPGVDDAHALLLAAAHPKAHIEAVTTVGGNVPLKHTTANACKILDALGLDTPVFAGIDGALLEREHEDAAHVHGGDGLGDAGIPVSARKVETEHAVQALIRLANENSGELSLVAIGPLTNLAVATRLAPELPQKYKELIVMGGAIYAQGNTPNTATEFNIYSDPEAAAIVFQNWQNITLSSWETTVAHPISESLLRELRQTPTALGNFFDKITDKTAKFMQSIIGREAMYAADAIAMAAAIEPSIITRAQSCHVAIERAGQYTRGQTIVDWQGRNGIAPNTNIILEINAERFYELMRLSVQ